MKIRSTRIDSIFFALEFIFALQFAQIHRNIMTAHFLVEMRVIATFAIDFPYVEMLRNEMENERESRVKKELYGLCIITDSDIYITNITMTYTYQRC